MTVTKILVKCHAIFSVSKLKIGKIYEAEVRKEPGITFGTKGYYINGIRYSKFGFIEPTVIEKLQFYNKRRKNGCNKS